MITVNGASDICQVELLTNSPYFAVKLNLT